MNAPSRTVSWTPRRRIASFVCLTSVGLVAGGTGGYLIHGTSNAAKSVPAPAVVVPTDAPALRRYPNADSQSGYESVTSAPALRRFPNADSQSGY